MALHGDAKRQYQLEWMAKRRNAWIESQGGKCARCGATENLEVDHIDRSQKKIHTRGIWSRNEAVRMEELAKCQVLCEDCHIKKTTGELTIVHPHGTYLRYRQGCKCGDCKSSVAPYWREYRSRKAAK